MLLMWWVSGKALDVGSHERGSELYKTPREEG